MEHVSHFNTFLTDVVNLPEWKLTYLNERTERLFDALKSADLGVPVKKMKKQGSWAQRTIIQPAEDAEFDADFMVELEERQDWMPRDYHRAVFESLSDYVEAQGMSVPAEAKNRCVRVTYANSMHVDVVPYVDRETEGENIVNEETNLWEGTDPDGFTAWMKERDEISHGNMRRVLRLLKYLRDHRGFMGETRSIILTTVVGRVITSDTARVFSGCYDSIPKTLHRVLTDLADWVRDLPERPEVEDPSSADSTFTHRWPQSEYDVFRVDVQELAKMVDEAIACVNSSAESMSLWQDVFGPRFGPRTEGAKPVFTPPTSEPNRAPDTSTGRSGRAG
ncbi:SMODS domain-containing nucleotidyltransferase [Microbacterium sp.]|uniref:SMODS domain-containing nucleotidyltransferase n=1 Tax=Microbacterium sp. TaxID=51671 RepID=UPI00289AF5C4|nr:nucleotidyltransferase [Microbacterium sp.]